MTNPVIPSAIRGLGQAAAELGLELRAVVPAGPLDEEEQARIRAWLEAGHHGEMAWLDQPRRLGDPRAWKPWARSLALFALPYPRAAGGFRGGGRVARYALGRDYHHVLGKRLERLGKRLRREGEAGRFRAVTDAAPLAERSWALVGRVGFRGKNTLLLDSRLGPWQLLGELLLDVELPRWRPPAASTSCGSCTRCLEACPTDAFPAPYLLDARRCISYLTIEHRGPIPEPFRAPIGDWVFGCDVCLEVCPFGDPEADHAATWGSLPALDSWSLEDLLGCTPEDFETAFRGSPIRRAGWKGMARNACVALGNLGRGHDALERAERTHPSETVRSHAAWARGRINSQTS